MMKEQGSDKRVLYSQVGQSQGDEFPQLKVVVGEEEVPIDVFGHGDLHFLLLVAFDVVDLGEDYETEELYDNH